MSTKIKGIIIEDEEMSSRHLDYLIKDIEGVEILSNFENGIKAIPMINRNEVDFILLDIETPELNGLDFIKFSNNLPSIIFTTSNPNYAGDAIKFGAIDFINKPIQKSFLEIALEKVKEQKTIKEIKASTYRDNIHPVNKLDVNLINIDEKEKKDKEIEQRKLNAILNWKSVQSRW